MLVKITLTDRKPVSPELNPTVSIHLIEFLFGIPPMPSFGRPDSVPLEGQCSSQSTSSEIGSEVAPLGTCFDKKVADGLGGAGGKRGGLLVRTCLPQFIKQRRDSARVVEPGVRSGIAGQQQGGLLVRACFLQGT